MTKLTDTQLVVLSSACRHDDGFAVRPENLKGAGAAKLAASLVAKGLVREIRAKPGVPMWREDESGRFALKVLKAGREAIGVVEDAGEGSEDQRASNQPAEPTKTSVAPTTEQPGGKGSAGKPEPKQGTLKRTSVIALLERPQGAAMDDLIAATGWLPHTTRAFLSGLRKGGLLVARSKGEGDKASVYRIIAPDAAAEAA